MPSLTRKSYDRFILPVERSDFTSIDYYRGIMFYTTGTTLYRVNPTTNKVMGVTDLEVINPIVDIDVEDQGTFLAICLNEKKVKRIDSYTGKVLTEIVIDRFEEREIVPFKAHSSITKALDGIYFIDGYFNSTLETNRIVKYNSGTKISTIVREIQAANYNDLEFDDIGLLRLTDTKGVIERYNIISNSPNFSKQIDEIPVGDPYPLRVEEIDPEPSELEPASIAPPDITYFIEQRFAFLTLEPNSDYLPCPNPKEWQLVLNPCISQLEQNINFIKEYNLPDTSVYFVDSINIQVDSLIISLNSSLNYTEFKVNITDQNGKVKGVSELNGNQIIFTLQDTLGDASPLPPSFEFHKKYHIEVIVKLDTDPEPKFHTFNLDFEIDSFPFILTAPFDFKKPYILDKNVKENLLTIFFNENITNANSSTVIVKDSSGAVLVGNITTDGKKITYEAPFEPGIIYHVLIDGITDMEGNTADNQGFSFKFEVPQSVIVSESKNIEYNVRTSTYPEVNGQTEFNITQLTNTTYSPSSGDLLVYVSTYDNLNSKYLPLVQQTIGVDYLETDPTKITFLNNTLTTKDIVLFVLTNSVSIIQNISQSIESKGFSLTAGNIYLDALENDQKDSYDKRQEIYFLKSEKENLEYLKGLALKIVELEQERSNLLLNFNTSNFPHNYVLNHIDKSLLELKSILGTNTVETIESRIEFVSERISILVDYVTKLEEKLRAAEFECKTPRLFFEQYEINASESYNPEFDGQTEFNLVRTYTPDNNEIKVFVNEIVQVKDVDYEETNSSTITFLNTNLVETDEVSFVFNSELERPNVVIPATGGSVVALDPIVNHIDFPEDILVGVGVQCPINLNLFKVYDAFDRLISLYELERFYFTIEDESIVELRVDNENYFLFGLSEGQTNLKIHIADTEFNILLNCETGVVPCAITPYACAPKQEEESYLYKLVLIDQTVCTREEKINFIKEDNSHLVVSGVTNTGLRKVNPGKWALMFEGTMVLPDTHHEGMILEYAQIDQPVSDVEGASSLALDFTEIPEKPLILEDSLLTDLVIKGKNNLKLSPLPFDRDLILQESLEFDPSNPENNPLTLQQNPGLSVGGSLQMQFICDDTPADDEENTILLQGNNGGRHPIQITWDGDYCYVLYEGECSAVLIDLKSIFRKVFISSPDNEIYGLGIHSTNIFAQARDLEGQEFALAKTDSKAIKFVEAYKEFLNGQEIDVTNTTPQISVTTTGSIFSPDTLEQNAGVIFNHNNQSGISLDPGQEIIVSFNTFKLLEGITLIAQTDNPLQKIVIESSKNGTTFFENDVVVINNTSRSVYELNQFLSGVNHNDYTVHVKFRALEENTDPVEISLVNFFEAGDRFSRDQIPVQQVGTDSRTLIVANQNDNQNLDFVFSPNPLDFLNQTLAAPINPLEVNALTNVLESNALVVSGLPTAGILPIIFSAESEFSAAAPVSPITDVRGNSELIYRAGLMNSYENLILNSDWKWGMLDWQIFGKPYIQFKSLLSDSLSNRIILNRDPNSQNITSGIISNPISAFPDTEYYLSFKGVDLTKAKLGFIRLDYFDIRGDFISSSAPIQLNDVGNIVSLKKITPDYTNTIKVVIGIADRDIEENPTTLTDTIRLDWVTLTEELTNTFVKYEDNVDVIKIRIET